MRVRAYSASNETLILCISSERVAKDHAICIKQEQRFLRDVAKVQARIQNRQLEKEIKIGEAIGRGKERYPRVARYYALIFDAKTRQLENRPLEVRRRVSEISTAAICCAPTVRISWPTRHG